MFISKKEFTELYRKMNKLEALLSVALSDVEKLQQFVENVQNNCEHEFYISGDEGIDTSLSALEVYRICKCKKCDKPIDIAHVEYHRLKRKQELEQAKETLKKNGYEIEE